MSELKQTERTRLRRLPDRGSFDRETLYAILDEAVFCHVAWVADGAPTLIPTAHWREGDRLYLHGSRASRLMRAIREGAEVCVVVTLLDGLVLARSAFHHSMNYRSVVVYGVPEVVEDRAQQLETLQQFIEGIAPGRWDELRPVTDAELAQTQVVALALDEASAKLRSGGPKDDEADYAHPVWAGTLPIFAAAGDPVPDERLQPDVPLPDYLQPISEDED